MEIRIKVENDMAKAEEIAIIEKLHNSFKGTSNYLTDFFSEDMCMWIQKQIKNDFPCEVFPYIKDNEEKNETIERMDIQIQGLLKNKGSVSKQIRNLREVIEKQDMELSKQRDIIASKDLQITHLKAKLYDATIGSTNTK